MNAQTTGLQEEPAEKMRVVRECLVTAHGATCVEGFALDARTAAAYVLVRLLERVLRDTCETCKSLTARDVLEDGLDE